MRADARQRNCLERGLSGGDEEGVGGFVDFDVAGEGVVSGTLAGEWVDVGEVVEFETLEGVVEFGGEAVAFGDGSFLRGSDVDIVVAVDGEADGDGGGSPL